LDYATKYCPQILERWMERGNQNQKPNHNVYKISAKKHKEGPRITVVTCGGSRIGVDATNGGK